MDKGEIPLEIYMVLSKAFNTLDYENPLHKLSYWHSWVGLRPI